MGAAESRRERLLEGASVAHGCRGGRREADVGFIGGCGLRLVASAATNNTNPHGVVRGDGFHQPRGRGDQRAEIGGLHVVFLPVLLDAGVVEDVLDERREAAAFLKDEA